MDKALAIGVFDSGMGGLTVLRALRHSLPHENFIYLGDTARLPYGTKSPDTIKQYAIQMARLLVARQIKALVIACNTATTAALSYLRTMLPDLPVLGVVLAGTSAALAATRNQQIAVWATEATIASGAYQDLIKAEMPQAIISARACSLLVALAEEGMLDNNIARAALEHYLVDIGNIDTILLGCTHFPVFRPLLGALLPAHVRIVDSAEATALQLVEILTQKNLSVRTCPRGSVQYLVSDSVARFQRVGSIFLDESLLYADIELIDISAGLF